MPPIAGLRSAHSQASLLSRTWATTTGKANGTGSGTASWPPQKSSRRRPTGSRPASFRARARSESRSCRYQSGAPAAIVSGRRLPSQARRIEICGCWELARPGGWQQRSGWRASASRPGSRSSLTTPASRSATRPRSVRQFGRRAFCPSPRLSSGWTRPTRRVATSPTSPRLTCTRRQSAQCATGSPRLPSRPHCARWSLLCRAGPDVLVAEGFLHRLGDPLLLVGADGVEGRA